MRLIFNMDLEHGNMEVEATYSKDDLRGRSFLLNRDFVVTELVCDVEKLDVSSAMSNVILDQGQYAVNSYSLPRCRESVAVKYNGYLDGTTGQWPYVQEQISGEFTFLRFETYCLPLFSDIKQENIINYIFESFDYQIEIVVPVKYQVLSPAKLKTILEKGPTKTYCFAGNGMIADFFNFAIAQYREVKLPSGRFFVVNTTDEDIKYISEVIEKTHKYMNENFGSVEIASSTKYVEIPNGFGAFTRSECVYCTESHFGDKNKIRNFIHEFIHLGWNAKNVAGLDQRIRFFDEAFTNYFTLRVIEAVIGREYSESVYQGYIAKYQQQIKIDSKKLVPICDFGKHEYGGLSYTIGALSLLELCREVGREKFDQATTAFLKKYRTQAVDLATFCQEYTVLCQRPDLKKFFETWLYSTKGPEKYLKTEL